MLRASPPERCPDILDSGGSCCARFAGTDAKRWSLTPNRGPRATHVAWGGGLPHKPPPFSPSRGPGAPVRSVGRRSPHRAPSIRHGPSTPPSPTPFPTNALRRCTGPERVSLGEEVGGELHHMTRMFPGPLPSVHLARTSNNSQWAPGRRPASTEVVEVSGLDRLTAQMGLEARLDGGYVRATDARDHHGLDYLDPHLLPLAKARLGEWPTDVTQPASVSMELFISHSSQDNDLARALIRLPGRSTRWRHSHEVSSAYRVPGFNHIAFHRESDRAHPGPSAAESAGSRPYTSG